MRQLLPLLPALFLGTLLAALTPAPVADPQAHWADSRHVLITWQQLEPATICVGRVAPNRGDYVLIGCDQLTAGPQQLTLPVDGPRDAETVPLVGDVYLVGDQRTTPLGPVPVYEVRLPLVRR